MKRWVCDGHGVTVEEWPVPPRHLRRFVASVRASVGAGARQWLMPKCALMAMPTPRAAEVGDMVPGAGYQFRSRCCVRLEEVADPVAAGGAPRRDGRTHRIARRTSGGGAA